MDFQGDEAWRAFELLEVVGETARHHYEQLVVPDSEAGFTGMGTNAISPKLDTKYADFITSEQHIPATGMPACRLGDVHDDEHDVGLQ